jgi:hypothetical protein
MSAEELRLLLISLGACQQGLDGTVGQSLAEVWATCQRPDWLLWLVHNMAGKSGWPSPAQVIEALHACIEAMRAESSPEQIGAYSAHMNEYVLRGAVAPLILSEDLVISGYFGGLKAGADAVRNNLKVPF